MKQNNNEAALGEDVRIVEKYLATQNEDYAGIFGDR